MKFFAVLFILLGVLLIFVSVFTAGNFVDVSYILNPTPIPEPGVPQITPTERPVYSINNPMAPIYLISMWLLGFAFIAQGMLFYNVGEINEKIDILLKDGR